MKINKQAIYVLVLIIVFAFGTKTQAQNKVTIKAGTFYAYKNSPQFYKLIFKYPGRPDLLLLRDEKGKQTLFRRDKNDKRLYRKQGEPRTYFSYGGRTIAVNFYGGRKGTWTRAQFAGPNPGLRFVKQLQTGDYRATLSYKDMSRTTYIVGGGLKSKKTNPMFTISHSWKLSYNSNGSEMYLTSSLQNNNKNLKKLSTKDRAALFNHRKFKLASNGYYDISNNRMIQVTSKSSFRFLFPGQKYAVTLKKLGGVNNYTPTSKKTSPNIVTANTINRLSPTSKRAQIHDAVQSSDYDKVERLITKSGADPNLKDGAFGRTALHYAANLGDSDIASYLVRNANAKIDLKDNQGFTALDLAIQKNNTDVAKTLLQGGANAAFSNKGLERVITLKNKELLKMFLQNGANATLALDKVIQTDDIAMLNTVLDNSAARADNTSFEKAVTQRSQQIAIELLIRGVDKDKAMDFVIKRKDKQMVSSILGLNPSLATSNKALVFAVEQRDQAIAQNAIDAHNANPTLGMAPAVKTNNTQMITYLLSKGADANDQMDEASGGGKKAIVELLLSQSANPDLGVKLAAQNNHVATLQVLLDASGDANLAMPIAIEKGNVAMVNMCIAAKKPADVYRSQYVVTACKKSNLDILNALLLAGADANPGMPISIAKKDVKLVRQLISAGANANKPEYIKKSSELRDHATAQVLVDNGADPNPGMPPAIKLGDVTMVDLLLKKGATATSPNFIATASGQGKTLIVKMLIDKGADANYGVLPSIKANRSKVLALLIKLGADASKSQYIKESVKHNNPYLTKIIIDAGGDANLALVPSLNSNAHKIVTLLSQNNVDVTDTRYLAFSVSKNFTATARALVGAGAKGSDWFDEEKGENLLHKSIRQYLNWSMVPVLVASGVDVNQKTKNGDSALHLAVYQGKKNRDAAAGVVNELIRAKANVNATNAKGETVLKAAPSRRKITKALRKAGAKKRI